MTKKMKRYATDFYVDPPVSTESQNIGLRSKNWFFGYFGGKNATLDAVKRIVLGVALIFLVFATLTALIVLLD